MSRKVILIISCVTIALCAISYDRGYQNSSTQWAKMLKKREGLHFEPDTLIYQGDGVFMYRIKERR